MSSIIPIVLFLTKFDLNMNLKSYKRDPKKELSSH